MSGTTTSGGAEPATGPGGPDDAGAAEATSVSEDEVFEVLANRRRRHTLHAIAGEENRTHELGELSERVAAWENEIDVAEVSYDERKRVYTALQQSHLPRLDEAGLVEFDKDRGVVEPTPALADVDLYLDVVRGKEIPWNEYYLGLSAFSLVVLAALWTDLLPTDGVPLLAYPTVLVAMFAVSAGYHAYVNRKYRFRNLERPP